MLFVGTIAHSTMLQYYANIRYFPQLQSRTGDAVRTSTLTPAHRPSPRAPGRGAELRRGRRGAPATPAGDHVSRRDAHLGGRPVRLHTQFRLAAHGRLSHN